MRKTICFGTALALAGRGYKIRHIAIIMKRTDREINLFLSNPCLESTLKFMTQEQKTILYVINKLLQLKPISQQWCSDDYYYITILKFLLVPRETIYEIYKRAPRIQVARAHKEKSPFFRPFDYTKLGITLDEYKTFVNACYHYINDPTKWR